MAGTFILGETKVRPGSYFNIQKKGSNAVAGIMNGVTGACSCVTSTLISVVSTVLVSFNVSFAIVFLF